MKRKYAILALLAGLVLSACQPQWEAPERQNPAEMDPTMTLADFKRLYAGTPLQITDENLVVGGRVVSSDASGNFYRTFYIQDETGGIEVKIGKTGLYNDYPVGMQVYVKPKYLCLGSYGGMVQLGGVSSDPKYETAWIDAQSLIDRTIFKGKTGEKPEPLAVTSRSQINDALLGVYVRIENVRYTGGDDGLQTWAVREDKENGIQAASGNQNFDLDGFRIVVRSSGYADFASDPVPEIGTRCNLTGILTKFYSTYQLVLNDIEGVEILGQ